MADVSDGGSQSQSDLNSYKKQECMPNNSDLISSMPDEIIDHILSLLPTKLAIQTTVLSKRWKNMWESVPTISFDYLHGSNRQKKADFIDKTLLRHKASTLNKFLLNFCWPKEFESNIDSWVKFATSRQVEELSLLISGSGSYFIPQFLYDHSFLVKLSLEGCTLLPSTASVSWKLLKELCFSSTDVSDEAIDSILVGCPLLEYMRLEHCRPIKQIASTSLLKLEIDGCFLDGYTGVADRVMMKIYTPHLQYFKLSGTMEESECILMDVSSLRQATLTFDMHTIFDHEGYMNQLIEHLSHVPQITFGMWCLKVLSIRELKGLHFPPLKWKTLNLNVTLLNCIVPAILNLLKHLSDLRRLSIHLHETLKLSADFEDRCVFEHFNMGNGLIWIPRMKTMTCPLLHLNIIEITGNHNCLGSIVGGLILDFLIRNSSVLRIHLQGKSVMLSSK